MRTIGLLLLTICLTPQFFYHPTAANQKAAVYVCPMHPEVRSSKPRTCPKCGMKLVAKPKAPSEPGASSGPAKTPEPAPVLAPAPAPAAESVEGYTCPMHPEVRAASPGKCPKCDMPLVPVIPAVVDEFNLRMESFPKAPKPNEKVRLRFSIFDPRTGNRVKQFAIMHDKLFHLFVVSQDLTEFQHIHPEYEADGSFTIETVLPRAGQYKIYSDFYPVDGTPQVLQQSIATAGYRSNLLSSEAHLTPDSTLVRTVDGMKIELKLEPTELIAGKPVTLKYHLTDAKTGEAVKDLVPYLGAWGHTLILSEDQADYVHSHPEETVAESPDRSKLRGGPDVTFNALLPREGNYRIWTQFQRGGVLTTVSFTIHAARL